MKHTLYLNDSEIKNAIKIFLEKKYEVLKYPSGKDKIFLISGGVRGSEDPREAEIIYAEAEVREKD